MVDYKVDKNFNLVRNDFGQFEEVTGKKEFQQAVVFELTERQQQLVGKSSTDNTVVSKMNLIINRVAKEFDEIDSIDNISVRPNQTASGNFEVGITYDTGDTFEDVI